ncbi:MAG: carotenoid biosynthesis protein [Bacteroidota bacterium]
MNQSIFAQTRHSTKTLHFVAGFLLVVHIAGVVGLAWSPTRPYFQWATPINLVISALLLLLFHREWNWAFVFFLVFTYTLGFGIEVIGVYSEVIFGSYQYGNTLGVRVMEVPPVIGVNWLVLSYCVGSLCTQIPVHPLIRSLLAAILMVLLDFFIEPVAIHFDFWHWENEVIPLRNFLGWFAVAWVIQIMWVYLPFTKQNRLAIYLLIAQTTFFLILYSIV